MQQTLITAAGALTAILAVLGLAAKLLRGRTWWFPAALDRTIVLRESIAIDHRRRLHLVHVADQKVLLLTGGNQDLVVGWLPTTPQ